MPARRGAATFVPLEKWLQSGWASEAAALGTSPRTKSHPPVELTVHRGVPDIARFTLNVSHLAARQSFWGMLPPNLLTTLTFDLCPLTSDFMLALASRV